ncbi:MAG: hypothetical protein F4110_14100 [Acidimicrobiaceae bacterium]|nr:hypothetical protein [Acidimicrobiaceae bacterium]MXZ99978.1 hypothetical protein [Acidimicrobiaceae bacterium]MYE97308.1 hypothetical protein [Acidimicrobiaceae bacterium]MYH42744.1 hypothetical protein [Acidimicrobiaceae bacterium]MYI55089.1 hypothetical protein [Acidimicrobiaceae bacterium]
MSLPRSGRGPSGSTRPRPPRSAVRTSWWRCGSRCSGCCRSSERSEGTAARRRGRPRSRTAPRAAAGQRCRRTAGHWVR